MKRTYLFIFFLMLTFNLMAQNETIAAKTINSKAFLIFSGGPSLPVGIFSSTDLNKSGAGYANLGFNININGGYQITDKFGVAGTVFYSRYNVNKKLNDNINSLFAITPPYSYTTDHWQYAGIVLVQRQQ